MTFTFPWSDDNENVLQQVFLLLFHGPISQYWQQVMHFLKPGLRGAYIFLALGSPALQDCCLVTL